jgi:hypothetical protein
MKRRIEYLESIHTIECLDCPALAHQLKQIYADVNVDLKSFSDKLASIQR